MIFFLLAQVAPVTSGGVAAAVAVGDPLDWRHVVLAISGCLALLTPLAVDYARKRGWITDGSVAARAVDLYLEAKADHDQDPTRPWPAVLLAHAATHPQEVIDLALAMLPAAHQPTAAAVAAAIAAVRPAGSAS